MATNSLRPLPLLPGAGIEIDLLAHFRDPDQLPLRFSAESSDTTIATTSLSTSKLAVTAVAPGTAVVTATAWDSGDLSISLGTTVTVPTDPDRAALVALYEATSGPHWLRNDNWLSDDPLDLWEGVASAAGSVTALQLSSNGLRGRIPSELAFLDELRTLNLSNNNLIGPIPPELGRIGSLKDLDLCWNRLQGPIPPALGKLSGLIDLSLCRNNLTGPIPAQLGSLTELTSLHLFFNQLDGYIPPELRRLTALETLDLAGNNLTGTIPAELASLTDLTSLILHSNSLGGPVPAELSRLVKLTRLSLSRNNLTGSIPPELASLSRLTSLELQFNELTGPIPPELGELSALTVLWMLSNQLTGRIPSELGQLTNLGHLRLQNNNLRGPLPRTILQLDALRLLGIQDNEGLCVPGVEIYLEWLDGVRVVGDGPYCNEADMEGLATLYESAGGGDWTHSDGWLVDPALDGWHGITADSLGRVSHLDLARNGLVGRLPPSLGHLLNPMTELRLDHTDLSGPLPLSLTRVPLRVLHFTDTDLCVPSDESFRSWLDAIPSHQGTGAECASLSDREILVKLHEATDGPNWANLENWTTDTPLQGWYGVDVDHEGRVTRLHLGSNRLTGTIPPELGRLAQLRVLSLEENALTGIIPPDLGSLATLQELNLRRNQLSGHIPPELGALAALERLDLWGNGLSGRIPEALGSLTALRYLSLGDNHLSGPIPEELDSLKTLRGLDFSSNQLSGRIPTSFGSLASLLALSLDDNMLTGPIPRELGHLGRLQLLDLSGNRLRHAIPAGLGNLGWLQYLHLGANDLTGPIPPELGNLARLVRLGLERNSLTGRIPAELGNLDGLALLDLSENNLTGHVPPELGNLVRLGRLTLDKNRLTGPIPRELGDLAELVWLDLSSNDLAGPVPPEFEEFTRLGHLALSLNSRLSGPLPVGLTNLRQLHRLRTGGTGLCAPSDPHFLEWLGAVEDSRVALCAGTPAYLMQAAQSREFPTPLVAGEQALLRVFPTATRPTSMGIPAVRATFFVDGREVHTTDIPNQTHPIPTQVDESSLSKSANVLVPEWVVQPGLEMVIEVDPDGEVDPSLGVKKRIPETGRLKQEVQAMPALDLTLIPFLWTEAPDSGIIDLVEAIEDNPEEHELLLDIRNLLPVRDLAVTAHGPVATSTNHASSLFRQTEAIRVLEGGRAHYKGMMSGSVTGPRGVGYAPGWASFSIPDPRVMAHELGHNMSLLHPPCDARADLDPNFPQADGTTGTWGYDFQGSHLVGPSTADFMSYCVPYWTGEYSFTTALRYRLREVGKAQAAQRTAPTRSILLWGGVNPDGDLFMEPAFVVDAPPSLPRGDGDYRLEGTTSGGDLLYSLDFEMPQVVDGEGARAFAFAVPIQPEWTGALARITLSGPGGSFTLDEESDRSVVILIDPRRHEVRGILDLPGLEGGKAAAEISASLATGGFKLLFSRGVPDASAWRP
ncbi:MAG: hypothetical protein OXF01_15330 [Gemmatimonadetes bacterium]|nr:hypothetical protein [Gemmatimonadota bacterium]